MRDTVCAMMMVAMTILMMLIYYFRIFFLHRPYRVVIRWCLYRNVRRPSKAARLKQNANNENVGDRSDAYMHSVHRSFGVEFDARYKALKRARCQQVTTSGNFWAINSTACNKLHTTHAIDFRNISRLLAAMRPTAHYINHTLEWRISRLASI